MSNAADVITPYGATHVKWSGGSPRYYKCLESGFWQAWSYQSLQWESVVADFCSSKLKPLK